MYNPEFETPARLAGSSTATIRRNVSTLARGARVLHQRVRGLSPSHGPSFRPIWQYCDMPRGLAVQRFSATSAAVFRVVPLLQLEFGPTGQVHVLSPVDKARSPSRSPPFRFQGRTGMPETAHCPGARRAQAGRGGPKDLIVRHTRSTRIRPPTTTQTQFTLAFSSCGACSGCPRRLSASTPTEHRVPADAESARGGEHPHR